MPSVVAAMSVGLAVAGGVTWGVPRHPLPTPPGPHGVGTRTVVVAAGGDRRLPVQVWYPTDQAEGGAPLFPSPAGFAQAVSQRFGVPAWPLAPLRRVRGHAIEDARPASATGRVVVLVHGWMGFRAIHADLAEHLASTGDVVVAADHVGGSLASQMPDGTVVPLDQSLLPAQGTPGYWGHAGRLVDRYAADLSAVLDGLPPALDGVLSLAGLDRVRVIGHSTGGGAAVRFAQRDGRVAGIVGLDPWVEPLGDAGRGVEVPLLALTSQAWAGNRNDGLLEGMDLLDRRLVEGTTHSDFTNLGYLSPVLSLFGMTAADPDAVHASTIAALDRVEAALPA